ncbi:MAG TPA: hypothetical protein DEH22_00985 [Chloroflexi bacterium]|nr:hypothetical protein [Chloroflexota bacterium]
MSIRWRLIFSYVFLAVLSVGVVGAITYQLAETYAQTRESAGLRANAQSIALQAEPLMYSPFARFELQQLADTSAFLGDNRVRILDAYQRQIADSGSPDTDGQTFVLVPLNSAVQGAESPLFPGMMFFQLEPGMSLPAEIADTLPAGSPVTIIESHDGPWGKQFTFKEIVLSDASTLEIPAQTPEYRYRSASLVLHPIGDPVNPVGYVELSEPLNFGGDLLADLRQALVTAGVGAVVLAVIFGLWNSQRLSSPLKSLARTSAQMGAGDLSVRANLQTGGEIGELANQFNQMADNLQSNIGQLEAERDALRRFIADASHELRTPVTALKNFNTLLQGPAADDPAAQSEFLSESQTQIRRLEWITHNLLDLSRLDAGLMQLDLVEHDLCEVIEAAAAPFKPLAAEKNISLVTQLPDEPVLQAADRPRLEMVLSNLLDNALKFTPEGGQVTVSLERVTDRILVRVRDTGVGILPEDLPHIFERFYRGRAHSVPGSGLGLSIVKSVVEAHGGEISVESVLGQGTEFMLVF